MASHPPSDGPGLHRSPPKTYSQSVSPSSEFPSFTVPSSISVQNTVCEVNDGAIEIDLPPDLLEETKPLWSNFIVGYFIGEAPHIGTVHATVNRIWSSAGDNSMIDAQFISPKSVLFKIDNDQTRFRVLQRHFWHISDIPLVVREWNPSTMNSKPDLTMIPLWVDFKNIPDILFSEKGLKFLGEKIGSTQRLHPKTERCVRLDVARLLIVVNLEKPLPNRIYIKGMETTIQVSYPWLPSRCSTCQEWGHKVEDCGKMTQGTSLEKKNVQTPANKESVLKWVPKDKIVSICTTTEDDGGIEVVQADVDDESTWSIVKKSGRSSPTIQDNHEGVEQEEHTVSPSRFQALSEVHEEGEYVPDTKQSSEDQHVTTPTFEVNDQTTEAVDTEVQAPTMKPQGHKSRSRPKNPASKRDQKRSASTNTTKKASLGKH